MRDRDLLRAFLDWQDDHNAYGSETVDAVLAARPAPERAEPGDLVDARQDPVHRDVGVSRPACVSRILPCPTCGEAWGRPADHALPLPVAICAVCGHSHGGHGVDDNGAYCTVEGCDCTAYDEIARTP